MGWVVEHDKDKYVAEVGHHSDTFDLLAGILETEFGIFVYQDPYWEGSCEHGFIVSNKKLNKKELKNISSELNDEE